MATESWIETTEEKRRIVASYLNLAPWLPETWPIEMLDRLISIREQEGLRPFMIEIMKMMEHPRRPMASENKPTARAPWPPADPASKPPDKLVCNRPRGLSCPLYDCWKAHRCLLAEKEGVRGP